MLEPNGKPNGKHSAGAFGFRSKAEWEAELQTPNVLSKIPHDRFQSPPNPPSPANKPDAAASGSGQIATIAYGLRIAGKASVLAPRTLPHL